MEKEIEEIYGLPESCEYSCSLRFLKSPQITLIFFNKVFIGNRLITHCQKQEGAITESPEYRALLYSG